MSDFKARINAVLYAHTLPDSYLDFPHPATMPTHCSVVDRTRVNGPQVNDVVPVIQDPRPPNIMDPAHQLGLFNPNAYVRAGVVQAMGKTYGVMCMKKAASAGGDPTDRIKDRATTAAIGRSVTTGAIKKYTRVELTMEELAAFDELIENWGEDWEEGAIEVEMERNEAVAGVESEGMEPAVGAAVVEKEGKEDVAGVEKEGKKPAEKQKKKQPKRAPVGTAWYLKRGKELNSKRTY